MQTVLLEKQEINAKTNQNKMTFSDKSWARLICLHRCTPGVDDLQITHNHTQFIIVYIFNMNAQVVTATKEFHFTVLKTFSFLLIAFEKKNIIFVTHPCQFSRTCKIQYVVF